MVLHSSIRYVFECVEQRIMCSMLTNFGLFHVSTIFIAKYFRFRYLETLPKMGIKLHVTMPQHITVHGLCMIENRFYPIGSEFNVIPLTYKRPIAMLITLTEDI